jgi:hypothetical protein
MHTHLQYQDLLECEGPDYFQGTMGDLDFSALPWTSHTGIAVDPQLHSSPQYGTYRSVQHRPHYETLQSFRSYNHDEHGFSPIHLIPERDSILPQFGVFDPSHQDMDHLRHMRHFSPSDPSGFTLSSNTDSSVSEYAMSPEMAQHLPELPLAYPVHGFYTNTVDMPPVNAPTWSCMGSYAPALPSMPVLASSTVPSMKHLQVTPDPEPDREDDFIADKIAFQSAVSQPEELEISEQIITPPDSGADQTMEDDEEDIKDEDEDEEDSGALQSDNESEFSLTAQRSHRKSSTSTRPKRQSMRESRKPRVVLDPGARVSKTSTPESGTTRAKSKKKPPVTTKSVNADSKNFPCAFHHYGCCAVFANKNEWKRHVSSQHLQLGFYRCDMDSCIDHAKGYNDFNRKDLFTQHCRRMHAPWSGAGGNPKKNEANVPKKDKDAFEKKLDSIRDRCWIDRRKAPASTKCGFCGKKFSESAIKETKGKTVHLSPWEERMEHIGRHFERDGKRAEDEKEDTGLRKWALEEGVVVEKKGEFWLVGFEPSNASKKTAGERRSTRNNKEEDTVDERPKLEARPTSQVAASEPSSDDEDTPLEDDNTDADAEAESDIDAEAEDDD